MSKNISELYAKEYLLRSILLKLIDTANQAKQKQALQAIDLIATLNQQILKAPTPTFIYNGCKYGTIGYEPTPLDNRILHIDLYDKVQEIVSSVTFKEKQEQEILRNYFSDILQFSTVLEIVQKILPTPLHNCLKQLKDIKFLTLYPQTDEQLLAFQQKHTDQDILLKQYLMQNLISMA